MASNTIIKLEKLKIELVNKYKVKDLDKKKTITSWQITKELTTKTLRISQPAYIKNLLKEKNSMNYNASTTLMKAGFVITINKLDNYEKAKLGVYQQLIGKLINPDRQTTQR